MCDGYVSSPYDPPRTPGPGERSVRVDQQPGTGVRVVIDGPAMPARESLVFTVDQARSLAGELRHHARQEARSAARARRLRRFRLRA